MMLFLFIYTLLFCSNSAFEFLKHCEDVKCPVCKSKAVILFSGQMQSNSTLLMIAANMGNRPGWRSSNSEYICCTALLCCPLTKCYNMSPNCPICAGPNPPHVVQDSLGGGRTEYCHCNICNNYCTAHWSVSQQKILRDTAHIRRFTDPVALNMNRKLTRTPTHYLCTIIFKKTQTRGRKRSSYIRSGLNPECAQNTTKVLMLARECQWRMLLLLLQQQLERWASAQRRESSFKKNLCQNSTM